MAGRRPNRHGSVGILDPLSGLLQDLLKAWAAAHAFVVQGAGPGGRGSFARPEEE